MKSPTSFFNGKALLKDLTRFAPAWGLYGVCLIIGMVLLYEEDSYSFAANLASILLTMPIINCLYALLTAQLLFGDLFRSRMCNALHALPLRREGWFAVHFTAGLLFSLVPTALMAGLSVPVLLTTPLEKGPMLALWWFLGTNGQYLFFFGSAVLACFCSGSRFAAAVVYGILQLGAMLVYFLISTIYTPLLYGVECRLEGYQLLCPMVELMSGRLIELRWRRDALQQIVTGSFSLTSQWGYLWLCSGVGLVLAGLALVLYRLRKLERAGDFIAVTWLKPVFLTLYCLTTATVFQFARTLYGLHGSGFPVLLFVGLVVGWFTGSMLLARSTRVFSLRSFLGLGALVLLLAGSLGLTRLDPLGVTNRIPELPSVSSITLHEGYWGGHRVDLCGQEDLQKARLLHRLSLEEERYKPEGFYLSPQGEAVANWQDYDWDELGKRVYYHISYQLESGGQLHRSYSVLSNSRAGALLRELTSKPEYLFGKSGLPQSIDSIDRFQINSCSVPAPLWKQEVVQELLKAVEEDCAAGRLAPEHYLHPLYIDDEAELCNYGVFLELDGADYFFTIYADSLACLEWMDRYQLRRYLTEQF